jgi:hypothetical protein
MEGPHEPIHVYVKKRSKSPTKATKRENEALQLRMRRNAAHYDHMLPSLNGIIHRLQTANRRVTLDDLAMRLAKHRRLQLPDRLARRKKPALICWFCEHCLDLLQDPCLNQLEALFPADPNHPAPPMVVMPPRPPPMRPLPVPQLGPDPRADVLATLFDEPSDLPPRHDESLAGTQDPWDWATFMI